MCNDWCDCVGELDGKMDSSRGLSATTPPADNELKYKWSEDNLPVTPTYIQNQLRYAPPPKMENGHARRAQVRF